MPKIMLSEVIMLSLIWPIALVVFSNTVYQICAKSVPGEISPFASLTITYLVAAAASAALYFVFNKGGSLIKEYSALNWSSFALGIAIVGLEVGCIFAYKNGWQVSMMQIVQSAFLAIALIFVGRLLYSEPITLNKALGIGICLVGLYFLNK